jgi:aminoglycoside 6-adenylyltransferase
MKHIYLRQVLEWRVELDHAWSVPVGWLGKGLKKRLPLEIWSALEKCFTDANIDENWMALERTMQLFRQVARDVGDALGYPYPEELHTNVADYVKHIRLG